MGRKYDDGGRKHVDQLVCDISSSTVKRPSPFANVSRHMARYAKTKGSSEDTHLPPSPPLLLTACVITGDGAVTAASTVPGT